tara:strand:- start:940 stop:2487 length:1548 start_codon:yes stop_codon:yes gene_type:complete
MNRWLVSCFGVLSCVSWCHLPAAETTVSVTVDRGRDIGQAFGSLFEATTADGSLVIGAGFQNAYNTHYQADRHALQFYIRPTDGVRSLAVEELPRPNNVLTGSYLFGRNGQVFSAYGGIKSWDRSAKNWRAASSSFEIMRLGNGTLAFGTNTVKYEGKTILGPPAEGGYQKFFYAQGHLCFYHVTRRGKPYHKYVSDEDGYCRLYACPWTPGEDTVDLKKAITLRLPVVGETTFAWGQLGNQIVTGSNIGGFYIFEKSRWRMTLAPRLTESYQLYSSLGYGDRLLMGQYPTGRVFEFDGEEIKDQAGWPPVMPGVSGSSREAQTTALYGGDLFVGVWPWAELWRYNRDTSKWIFMKRMFDHPELTNVVTHPYEAENRKIHPVANLWGQRVTSLVPNGPDLFLSTSSKGVDKWLPEKFPFLLPEKWKSYGKVYKLTMPGHLAAAPRWTDGPSKISFVIRGRTVTVVQDGQELSQMTVAGRLAEKLGSLQSLKPVRWGNGLYGRFGGVSLKGVVEQR